MDQMQKKNQRQHFSITSENTVFCPFWANFFFSTKIQVLSLTNLHEFLKPF